MVYNMISLNTSSLSVLLMMGTPAVTSAFNGSRDLVDGAGHAPRGRVIADPNDVDALARAMSDLIEPTELASCRAASRGLKRELSMQRHAERLEVVLGEVAAGKAKA